MTDNSYFMDFKNRGNISICTNVDFSNISCDIVPIMPNDKKIIKMKNEKLFIFENCDSIYITKYGVIFLKEVKSVFDNFDLLKTEKISYLDYQGKDKYKDVDMVLSEIIENKIKYKENYFIFSNEINEECIGGISSRKKIFIKTKDGQPVVSSNICIYYCERKKYWILKLVRCLCGKNVAKKSFMFINIKNGSFLVKNW